jgi:hypothetical protein
MPNVRPLTERDALQAGRIIRLAFGTFLGAPDPESFFGDLDFVRSRFGAENVEAYGAEEDGVLLGSNFATRWGSVGFFGPLSIRPDRWDGGAAQPLVGAACEAFERWNVSHAGLFTFAQSAKHIHLYGKFGFYPRFLTAIMSRPAAAGALPDRACYSGLAGDERRAVEDQVSELTDAIYPGLDLRGEIRNVAQRDLGETLLLRDGERVAGFAVCHSGPGTEAGSDQLFVKFGAVRAGSGADERFAALLAAASALAAARGMKTVTAGVNLAREEAYRQMKESGFRTQMQGVAMHRGNEPGYCRPGVFVIDDWR